ncbi:MAG: hypothetical protein ACI4S3_06150, partial [Candidatus Gastranaerophilaceae bacterium]
MFIPNYSLKQIPYGYNSYKNSKFTTNYASKDVFFPKLSPLMYDTISFGACKKREFKGIDYAVVEKFNAPIEKFNSNVDLQTWSEKEVEKIYNKDFGGRQQETQIQRKAMLKEWKEYVCEENDAYSPTMQLLILDSVTKNLKPNEDKLPPVLNKGVLADTMDTLNKRLNEDNKYQFNFNKLYQTKLNALYLETGNNGSNFTGWVKIPSKQNDPENFEANVDKLKTLSHKNWCTKSYNAEPYLVDGDFHVYLENGKPKLGVRFVDDRIEEIQGEYNNGKIPIKYFDVVEKHIADNKFKLNYKTMNEIRNAQKVKDKINKVKADLGDAIKNNDTKAILEYFGTKCEILPDGMLRIDTFKPISEEYSYDDLGVNENKLFENIKEITGDIDFGKTDLISLGKLVKIGGNADFKDSKVTDLGNLELIEGNADFSNSQITSLGELKEIRGDADFYNSKVTNLGKLERIGGSLYCRNSQTTSLGNLKEIGMNAFFCGCIVTDLRKLERIGGEAYFLNSKITSLDNLKEIGNNAHFCNSIVTDLGKLERIGGNAEFGNSQITYLGNLKEIGGNADFQKSQVTDLVNLEKIGGDAYFENSQITSLGNLKEIGKNAYFHNSVVTDLGKLKQIGGSAKFNKSRVKDLGKLERIP